MEKITHRGIIVAVKNKIADIKIISRSACSQCPAHNHCGTGEQKEKIISIPITKRNTFKTGDEVVVSISAKTGLKAVIYGYIIPLILLLAAIIITKCCGHNDFISGISGIIILIPYYFGLFLAKDRLKSLFEFEIKHRD